LEAYDLVSDLSVAGKGIPWDKQDPGEEAIESLSAEVHNLLFHTAFLVIIL
jgi:poly [ADP-ribose] polymerase